MTYGWVHDWLRQKQGRRGLPLWHSPSFCKQACCYWFLSPLGLSSRYHSEFKIDWQPFFFFLKHCFPSRLWTPQGQRVNLFCSLSRPKHSSLLDTWQGCPEVMVMVITEVMTFPYSDFWNNFRVPLLILFHSTVLAPKLAFVWILQLLFSFHSFLSHHS